MTRWSVLVDILSVFFIRIRHFSRESFTHRTRLLLVLVHNFPFLPAIPHNGHVLLHLSIAQGPLKIIFAMHADGAITHLSCRQVRKWWNAGEVYFARGRFIAFHRAKTLLLHRHGMPL